MTRAHRAAQLSAAEAHGEAAASPHERRDVLEDRILLIQVLVHCADLHTPTLEPAMARRIAENLSKENEAQAEMEKAAGLKVTVMLAGSAQAKAAMEISFIQFVVRCVLLCLVVLCAVCCAV